MRIELISEQPTDVQPGLSNSEKRLYWLLLALVSAILCLPLLTVKYIPLVDYPNHLARVYILRHYHDILLFQQNYRVRLLPVPNLAIDLIVLFFLHWFSILTAGRMFLILAVLLFVAGCHLLAKSVHGRPSWLVIPCAFFAYSTLFFWGFVNDIFSLSMFLVTLAFWYRWREHWTVLRWLAVALLVLGTYFSHITGYSFVAGAVGLMTLWFLFKRQMTLGRAVISLLPLVPPVIFFLTFMQGGGRMGNVRWSGLYLKIAGAFGLILTYNYYFDACILLGFAAVLVIAGIEVRQVRIVQPVFLVGAVFAMTFLLAPFWFLTGVGADDRFVPAAAVLLALSVELDFPRRAAKFLLAGWLALATVRVGFVWHTWVRLSRQTAAQVEAFRVFPEGARVLPFEQSKEKSRAARGLHESLLYATIMEHAFVPGLFANKSQQPVLFRNEEVYKEETEDWRQYIDNYDFAWSYLVSPEMRRELEKRCIPVKSGDGFTIWQIKKPASGG